MKAITLLFSGFVILVFSSFYSSVRKASTLNPVLTAYLKSAEKDFSKIPDDRKAQLKKIALYLKTKLSSEKKASLVFICTHNSRRSHMSQLWAYAASAYYGISGVASYSGGTEGTAFNERAVKALMKSGFAIKKTSQGTNPNYEVKYAENMPAVVAFSKKYSDAPNPSADFAAVMTCSQADKSCPVVQGASIRIAIPYEDPKVSDGKPNEEAMYNERCKQIATEILYAFSLVKTMK